MIKPEMLWNFLKTCDDTMKVGRVCRTLGRQNVEGVTPDEMLLVKMIDNDSSWMDEKYEEIKRKDRERKRQRAEELRKARLPTESMESTESTESTESAPYLPTHSLSCPPDISNDISNIPPISPKGDCGRVDMLFEEFWQSYPSSCPRKVDKKKCLEKFRRILKDGHKIKMEIFTKIMDGLEVWKKSETWQKDDGQFICAPSVWLNNNRWEDTPKAVGATTEESISKHMGDFARELLRQNGEDF